MCVNSLSLHDHSLSEMVRTEEVIFARQEYEAGLKAIPATRTMYSTLKSY